MEKFLDYFTPRSYQLRLEINRQAETLSGEVRVFGTVASECVKLHAVDLDIESVEYYVNNNGYDDPESRPCRFEYDGKTLSIPTTPDIAPEFFRTRRVQSFEDDFDFQSDTVFVIKYKTRLSHNMQGCYLSSYDLDGEPQQIAATQFESHYAREAFPCIDEPAAKASFSLMLTVPDLSPRDTVLANTPLSSHYSNHFNFETTPKMSTYLLAWVIGPLQSVSTVNRNGVKVSSYCALNQPLESLLFANQTAARALEYYDEKFGQSYPLSKLDQVALPDFEAGAMENWGLVTYRESMMLVDRDGTLDTKKSVATTVTHELSHQWFGDLVTMTWWDDLWLNESFATIMEYYATDALYPDLHIWEDFFTGDCLAALKRDSLRGVQSVKQAVHHPAEIATLFDSAIVYAKGARLVLMLIRLMGETEFDKGLRYYFKKYAYRNTVGDDLWAALQPYADFEVQRFMDSWISQPGYPELRRSSDPHDPWIEQRFLIDGTTDSAHWPLLNVRDDMSGHYLIHLDSAEFSEKLAQFSDLTTEQKLRFMIDHMLLARAGTVDPSALLELIPRLSSESSAAVWEILSSIISDLKLFCPLDSTPAENYKTFLRTTLHSNFAALDLSRDLDSDALRRRDILLGIAYYAEDLPTLERLAERYSTDFSTLDPELRPHILSAQLHLDESKTFSALLAAYKTASDPELKLDLLATLGLCSRLPESLARLETLLSDPDTVRPQDNIFLYVYLLRNPHSRLATLRWLTEHWDFVVQLTGDKSVEDYARYAANVIRTTEEAQLFSNFFDPKHDDPVLARTLEVARGEIAARLALIERYAPTVARQLTQLTEGN